MSTKHHLMIILISMIACIAGLLMGFDSGVISGALPYIQKTFGIEKTQVFLSGFVVSSVPVGAFFGAIVSSPIVHKWGRKRTILLSSVLFFLGSLIASIAPHIYIVILGRLVMGLSIGLATMAVPMYLSEISPTHIRGAIITAFQLAITCGLLLAFVINYIFADHENWRFMFLFGSFLGALLGVGMIFMPFSPQWLMQVGKEKLAKETMLKIRDEKEAEIEISRIRETVQRETKPFYMLFVSPFWVLTLFSSSLFMFQQLSGINAVFYYSATVFKSAGFATTKGAILASIIIGTINVISTIISLLLIDVIGRRKLFIIGFIGIILSLTILGLYYLGIVGKQEIFVPVIAISGFVFFFAISLGNGPYVMMSEIYPLEIRHAGVAISTMSNWGFNILISETFLGLVYYLSDGYTFLLYAAISCVGLIYTYINCPETKGVPLQEIEAHLFSGVPLRKLGR